MMEIFHVQDMAYELGDPSYRQGNHGQDMLMAYLPKEKTPAERRPLLTARAGRGAADADRGQRRRCIRTCSS